MVQTELLQPQEIEVYYVLPMLRRQIALAMKDLDIPQKEIAQRLHIGESTVSQYIKEKRGSQIEVDPRLREKVFDSAKRIQTKTDLIRETQSLLYFIRHSAILCQIHHQITKLPDNCMMQDMGCDKE